MTSIEPDARRRLLRLLCDELLAARAAALAAGAAPADVRAIVRARLHALRHEER
ncbi:hypothetical protein Dvina_38760 [Dactylosporangium vinaceum]|uniref:Uncharacterized protein n=1 Tax=Dactylosporangium vinaceum TaxID=53362 RepID=A0ABV5ML90_9ACTN|nr:hypothetical protein [Dactylosporangium vinaceum]UAB94086.1 hypothetical protein Dvina_38760 [Dactylosporangium vinaceum]